MAVLQMQRIRICGMKKDRKQILELLQRRGVIEIEKESPKEQDAVFQQMDVSSARSVFDKNASTASQALDVLNEYDPVKSSMLSALSGRKPVSLAEYEGYTGQRDELMQTAYGINGCYKEIAEAKAEILKLQAQLEALVPWMDFDLPMNFQGTRSTTSHIGTMPPETTLESLYAGLAKAVPEAAVTADIISADEDQACVFVLCLKRDGDRIGTALSSLGFSRPPSSTSKIPTDAKRRINEKLEKAQERIDTLEGEIKSHGDRREALKFMVDYFAARSEKYEVLGQLLQSRRVFLVSGFIPKQDVKALEGQLDRQFDVAVEVTDPAPDEETPVLLKNSSFVEPVEPVLESYSLPNRSEIDPSAIMAIFYYVLFGMLLSDAAYGLIMIIGCGIALKKFPNMETTMRKTIKMFFICGFSTLFWGVMFGSYFGDVVDVFSQTFLGVHYTIPALWFLPLENPMRLMVFSFLLGVIHLFTGLGIKFYQLCKAKQYKDALYDVVFWYLLVGGAIIYLLTTEMFTGMMGLTFILPQALGNVMAVFMIIGAVGITLTAGRESRNPVKRLLKGLYGLYNVSGYLSDILSYSRLLALGLATGVIASVINKMGSMTGGGVVGIIAFIVIFLAGNAINIGINLLGAYVHCNRLQYVEFFGKFYEGGGRKFSPFAMHTKYYKIKEDN